jgi:hypothetical protein
MSYIDKLPSELICSDAEVFYNKLLDYAYHGLILLAADSASDRMIGYVGYEDTNDACRIYIGIHVNDLRGNDFFRNYFCSLDSRNRLADFLGTIRDRGKLELHKEELHKEETQKEEKKQINEFHFLYL